MTNDHQGGESPDKNNHVNGERDNPGWAESPLFVRVFLLLLLIAAVLAAIAGFIPEFQKKHPHFAAEKIPVFFAVWGFGSFMFIVLVGQHLRKLVGREEGYYDDRE